MPIYGGTMLILSALFSCYLLFLSSSFAQGLFLSNRLIHFSPPPSTNIAWQTNKNRIFSSTLLNDLTILTNKPRKCTDERYKRARMGNVCSISKRNFKQFYFLFFFLLDSSLLLASRHKHKKCNGFKSNFLFKTTTYRC